MIPVEGDRQDATDHQIAELRVAARMSRADVEALQIEIRRLARQHGLEVQAVRTVRSEVHPSRSPQGEPDSTESA